MKPRIEIFMLKLDCGENFVLFGYSGHELQRFKDLVFTIHLYGILLVCHVITLSLQR